MPNLPLQDILTLAGLLVIAGGVSGILAGLFGVGGGAILVPVLYQLFSVLDVPLDYRMHLSVGTSLAIIIPVSIRSFRAHYLKGAVDLNVLKIWSIPVVLGVLLGAFIAAYVSAFVLKTVFAVIAAFNSYKLLAGRDNWRFGYDMPGRKGMWSWGLGIGFFSSLMGIGGGQLSNLAMTLYGRSIHQAVATSAGIGVLVSVPGAVGFMVGGWPHIGKLPVLSVGYVSFLGFLLMVPLSVIMAPVGVKLAHHFSKRTLEKAFGIFLLLVAGRFAISIFA